MASPTLATTGRGGSRFYTWRGENYFSVTTMLGGGIPKPALINWAKKFVATYAIEHIDSLVVLAKDDPEGAIGWLKDSPWRDRDKAAELGTDIHEAVEAYVLGKPFPPWKPAVKPRMEQFKKFLDEWQPVFEQTEATVFNRSERYAGTLDAIVRIGAEKCLECDGRGRTTKWGDDPDICSECSGAGNTGGRDLILDMKSGKAVYPEVSLQLAMYRFAEFIAAPNGDEIPMPQVDGGVALHLTDEGYELIDVDISEHVFKTALHAREIYRWQTETSKTVLRGPLRLDAPPEVQVVGQMLLDGKQKCEGGVGHDDPDNSGLCIKCGLPT